MYEEAEIRKMHEIKLEATRDESYSVHIVSDLLHPENGKLKQILDGRKALVVTTPTVARLYGARLDRLVAQQGLDLHRLVIETRHQSDNAEKKTLEEVQKIIAHSVRLEISRKCLLVGLGGGVCTDTVGLAAGLIRRGIEHVRIPTTLMGQIDAGIGLKCGVNFEDKKNYIGLFNPPMATLIDPAFLGTLQDHHMREGIAEIIKIALMCSAGLFHAIERVSTSLVFDRTGWAHNHNLRILTEAVQLMLRELQLSPYERRGFERLVDFGHCFSPKLESASQYAISHGRAVAIDMALTVVLAHRLGFLTEALRDRCLRVIQDVGLPLYHPLLTVARCKEAIVEAERHRGGMVNFPMPTAIGTASFMQDARLLGSELEPAIAFLEEMAKASAQ